MFGFEYSDFKKHNNFPEYEIDKAVSPQSIKNIVPLVWQEHCVECAMPYCYKSCLKYEKRSDGRCKLFRYGIEQHKNSSAILNQNAVIDMREWAKLETFFYTKVMPYKRAKLLNRFYSLLAFFARFVGIGKLRLFLYFVKEFFSLKIGYGSSEIQTNKKLKLLFEIYNDNEPYSLILENHTEGQIIFRTSLNIKFGYNRFWIPIEDLKYSPSERNYLHIFPENNKEAVLKIISLELVELKEEYEQLYFDKPAERAKVVVWDLDNTLWDGIISEVGVENIKLNDKAVKIIKELDSKGILNSISSKNDSESVIPALKQLGIYDYFLAPMINWNPKSENIKAIAKNLDLGINTFVFVDDSDNELQEVLNNCEGIRVCKAEQIEAFFNSEEFNFEPTEESKHRRQSYKEISLRNSEALKYKDDITDFLISCKMNMLVNHPSEDEKARCYELIQRTNQLNISGERLTKQEYDDIRSSENFECFRIKVNDKYGDYGLVGFAVFDVSNKETVELKHFVFSCRAARKKLEQSFFEYMLDYYLAKGYKNLKLLCKKTKRNQLMRTVLTESGLFQKQNEIDDRLELFAHISEEHIMTGISNIEFK